MTPETRLAELKLELPPAPKPLAVYKPMVVCGTLAYVSGHGPLNPDKSLSTGRVGAGLDHQQLTFLHNGRDERPTINGGEAISAIIA